MALKWRPKNFSEVVGQEHIVKPLEHALAADKLHHAYLFSGTRGIGKTTLARILARCLNCDTGITATPCGECNSCKAILAGHFTGLIEIDAASRTQVADTRELLETVSYSPMDGRYKVYLIDEVHMLSTHSFNALLKTLEEPPDYVCFLFATTEPEKLPATIISRCLQFNLRAQGEEAIAAHIEHILKAEDIPCEEGASKLLAQAARGSMRDGLTLTEQAVAYGSGALKTEEVAAMLGTIDKAASKRILAAVAAGQGRELMREIDNLTDLGTDPERVLDQLLRFLYETALRQAVAEAVVDPEVAEVAESMDPEEVQLYYQVALTSGRDLKFAPDAWIGLRMSVLRMLSFAPGATSVPRAAGGASGNGAETAAPAGARASEKKAATQPKAAPKSPAKAASDPAPPAPAKTQPDTAAESEPPAPAGAKPNTVAEPEPKPPAKAEPDPVPDPESSAPPKAGSDLASEPESRAPVRAEPDPVPDPESSAPPKAGSDLASEPESRAPVRAESDPVPDPESSAPPKAGSDLASEPESRAPARAEPDPVPDPESSAPPKAGSDLASEPESRAPVRAQTEPVPQPDAEARKQTPAAAGDAPEKPDTEGAAKEPAKESEERSLFDQFAALPLVRKLVEQHGGLILEDTVRAQQLQPENNLGS